MRGREDQPGCRELPYRNKLIFNEILGYSSPYFDFDKPFNFLNFGAGTSNPLALPIMFSSLGAKNAYALEPGNISKDKTLFGLNEAYLDIISKPSEYGTIEGYSQRLANMANAIDLPALFKYDLLGALKSLYLLSDYGESITLDDNSIDLIYSRSVFEHILNFSEVVAEIDRVLSDSGVMVHDIDFTAHNKVNKFSFYYVDSSTASSHLTGLNRLRLPDYLEHFSAMGFEVNVVHKESAERNELNEGLLVDSFSRYSIEDLLISRAIIVVTRKEITTNE